MTDFELGARAAIALRNGAFTVAMPSGVATDAQRSKNWDAGFIAEAGRPARFRCIVSTGEVEMM